jgi:2-polyprenyl-6-methoxyphenol hydroxylase-like FAD-dependent oxidoreductase
MYDAIVVGARCAGSPVAMLLARHGHRVLLVDRTTFPSDTISTHIIWPPAVNLLETWGVRGDVEKGGAPPLDRMTIDVGPFTLSGTPTPLEGNSTFYCCRRTVLDHVLVQAAAAAGAEVREGFTVTGLVEEGGRVTGIRGHERGGKQVTEEARIVIGADGLHSRVADMVGAAKYNERPGLTCGYYSYFSGVDMEATLAPRDGTAVGGVPTNDGTFIGIVQARVSEAERFRADPESSFWAAMDMAPGVAERLRAGTREERFHGTADIPNFFRVSNGPGWALVGDAGYHKDPLTAMGISDAFRDAAYVAGAVHEGLAGDGDIDTRLADYAKNRDETVMPIYEFTLQLAELEPPPPDLAALLEALQDQQEHINRFLGVFAATVPVPEFMDPENLGRIMSRT